MHVSSAKSKRNRKLQILVKFDALDHSEGCEIAGFAGNIQDVILSQALQGYLLRLEYSISNRSRSFFSQWSISESYFKAQCLQA